MGVRVSSMAALAALLTLAVGASGPLRKFDLQAHRVLVARGRTLPAAVVRRAR